MVNIIIELNGFCSSRNLLLPRHVEAGEGMFPLRENKMKKHKPEM